MLYRIYCIMFVLPEPCTIPRPIHAGLHSEPFNVRQSYYAHVIALSWTSVRPSARLSVRHTLVGLLYRNGSTYCQTVFTAW